MPELPEVETVVRVIRPKLRGKKFTDAKFSVPRQLLPQTGGQVRRGVTGRKITGVRRRGKYIFIEMANGVLVIHLRMTGRLYVRPIADSPHPHERAWFTLDNESVLVFRDSRTLGTISFAKPGKIAALESRLGWEPLADRIAPEAVRERLRHRKTAIKPLLLDQTLWAGIGNIYASEILWVAQISPTRSASGLTKREIERIVAAVRMVLERAVEKGGSTIRDFMGAEGEAGAYQKQFRVYERAGKPCFRCGHEIVRVVQAQRSTYYCKGCQKKKS